MEDFEPLDVGDKVKHPKFGVGTVMQRLGETETQKVIVKFGAEFGEKKLVTTLANMKRISERPTLSAAPAAPGTFPGAPAPSAPKPAAAKDDDEEVDEDEEALLGDDDEEEPGLEQDEGETDIEVEEEAEEEEQ